MSEPFFVIEMLPARDGDCLWVEWGGGDDSTTHRMLIDGGRSGQNELPPGLAAAFDRRDPTDREFDVVVGTHIDADHLDGLVALLRNPPPGFGVSEFWFNALRHLPLDDLLGPASSDRLEVEVARFAERGSQWNARLAADERHAIFVPGDGPLPETTVHGMKITLLSPTRAELVRVRRKWPSVLVEERLGVGDKTDEEPVADDILGGITETDAGVEPSVLATRPFEPDTSAANAASIAFVAEFAGRRVLFGADAHAEILLGSLSRWQPAGHVELAAVKLSHHGSAGNTPSEFIARTECATWLCSTNGALHSHPNRRAISRLIARNKPTTIHFNYHSEFTEEWGRPSSQMQYGYSSFLPPKDHPGCRFDVIAGEATELPR